MSDSAPSVRERRASETSDGLRDEARRLTAERGLNGFTIEELCSEVGVSRRTFFNYYASKESAVLGITARTDESDLDEAFLASTGDLLEDLADLHLARWARRKMTKAQADEMGRVFDREPRLFTHFIGLVGEGERDDIALVSKRADAATAGHAEAAVIVFAALIRPSVFEFFSDETQDFRSILLRRLSDARAVFSR